MQVFIFERTLSGHLRRVDCYPQRFCFLKATQGCQDRARDNIVALFRFDFCSVTMDAEPGGGIEVELGLVVSQCRVQQFRCYIPEPFSPPGPVQSSLTSPACQMGLLVHKDSVDVYVVKVPLGPMLCPNSKTPQKITIKSDPWHLWPFVKMMTYLTIENENSSDPLITILHRTAFATLAMFYSNTQF